MGGVIQLFPWLASSRNSNPPQASRGVRRKTHDQDSELREYQDTTTPM